MTGFLIPFDFEGDTELNCRICPWKNWDSRRESDYCPHIESIVDGCVISGTRHSKCQARIVSDAEAPEDPGCNRWHPAEELPPVDRVDLVEDDGMTIKATYRVPVLAWCESGEMRVVQRMDEEGGDQEGYEWHGWTRVPDDGCAETVLAWMPLPEKPPGIEP